jgi:hypothetical protein
VGQVVAGFDQHPGGLSEGQGYIGTANAPDVIPRIITIFHLLMVAHTERSDTIHIISARELTSTEREAYEEGY